MKNCNYRTASYSVFLFFETEILLLHSTVPACAQDQAHRFHSSQIAFAGFVIPLWTVNLPNLFRKGPFADPYRHNPSTP